MDELYQWIEKNSGDQVTHWLQKNQLVISSDLLSGRVFKGKSPLHGTLCDIPIFMAIRKRKLSAFSALVEGGVSLIVKDNFECTILDALCQAKFLEGLDYVIKKRPAILYELNKLNHGHHLSILHNITQNLSDGCSTEENALALIDKLLQLSGAQCLIDSKMSDKTFLQRICDPKTSKKVEAMIIDRGLTVPVVDQPGWLSQLYNFFQPVSSAVSQSVSSNDIRRHGHDTYSRLKSQ